MPFVFNYSQKGIGTGKGLRGGVAKWSNAPDCKSGDFGLRRFKSSPLHSPSLLRSFGELVPRL